MGKKENKKKDKNLDDSYTIDFPEILPVLPARDLVAFPAVMMSFYVGRDISKTAIDEAKNNDGYVLILAQKDEENDSPGPRGLYRVGVVAHIIRSLKLSENRYKVLVQGVVRARVVKYTSTAKVLKAKLEPIVQEENFKITKEAQADLDSLLGNLQLLVDYEGLAEDLLMLTEEVDHPGTLADLVTAHLKPDPVTAQEILEELDPIKRLALVSSLVASDIQQLRIGEEMRDRAEDEMMKGQREYFLREQLRQIRQELGEEGDETQDLSELKSALEKSKLPPIVEKEAFKQFKRLEQMNPETSDAALLRTYLEWITDLPWNKRSKDILDLKKAKKILDEDHYGLEKVKDRILEYLSVRKLNKDSKGPILCIVGPPGVGKTSLGRSVAKSLGRSFYRISLGGMRDEAEIRGHRRTYVGALPGRIIQGMKQVATKNPVFVFDELDKIGADFRGDPASALLEVLDPEQNKEFSDHYLNVPFDLSEVMFFATANTTDTIPSALLDRLEVIRIPGYTTKEKVVIAQRYLMPRQLEACGLTEQKVEIADDVLLFLIERYTREAGVRNLEREIGSLLRKVARKVAESEAPIKSLTIDHLKEFLGPTRYDPEMAEREDDVGLVTGLAWTVFGGEPMLVEASVAKGKGSLSLTGQLGDVMKESAQAAIFYARSNAQQLGLDPYFFEKFDIHVHCPAGATPKDGPSAGVTMVTAVVSALSGRKVSKDYAMTGEITLRGNVLAVGGIKEKALAALQYGVHKIIIPHENMKDTAEIPAEQREKIEFIPVKTIQEVLDKVLLEKDRVVKGKRSGSSATSVEINKLV